MLDILKKEYKCNRDFYLFVFFNFILIIFFTSIMGKLDIQKMYLLYPMSLLVVTTLKYSELNRIRILQLMILNLSAYIITYILKVDILTIYAVISLILIVYWSKNFKKKLYNKDSYMIKLFFATTVLFLIINSFISYNIGGNRILYDIYFYILYIFLLPIYESCEKNMEFEEVVLQNIGSVCIYIFFIIILYGIFEVGYNILFSLKNAFINTPIYYNDSIQNIVFWSILIMLGTFLYLSYIFIKDSYSDRKDRVINLIYIPIRYGVYILKYILGVIIIFFAIKLKTTYLIEMIYIYFIFSILEKMFNVEDNIKWYRKSCSVILDIAIYIILIGCVFLKIEGVITLILLGILSFFKYRECKRYSLLVWVILFIIINIKLLGIVEYSNRRVSTDREIVNIEINNTVN